MRYGYFYNDKSYSEGYTVVDVSEHKFICSTSDEESAKTLTDLLNRYKYYSVTPVTR